MGFRMITVPWGTRLSEVWVEDNFDQHLDSFAAEVGGQLTEDRCPFGVLLWPSARGLAAYLAENPLPAVFAEGARLMDLGCGIGFLACVLATLYPQCEVIASDYEPKLAFFAEKNVKQWGLEGRVDFQRCDWRQPVPEAWKQQFSAVFAADVFYDDSHLIHVPSFAHQLLAKDGLIILADPRRYRFGQAMANLKDQFDLISMVDCPQSMLQDGIEEFMVPMGLKEQMITLMIFRKKML